MREFTNISLSARQRFGLFAFANSLWIMAFLGLFTAYGIDYPRDVECVDRAVDFHALWGAGRLAYAGDPLSAFSHAILLDAFKSCPRDDMFWLYPAPVMVLLTAVGAVSFFTGYVALMALSLILIALSARPFLRNDAIALSLVVFAPAWLPALLSGQLTLLWCAGLMAALYMMRQNRHVAAGILIGCLTLKPTLGLLIPVILFAERRYATIIVATGTTIIIHVAAIAFYGFDYVTLWMDVSFNQSAIERGDVAANPALSSFGSFTTLFGVPGDYTTLANAGLLIVLAVILFFVWRKHGVKSDAACAALCAAIPLSAPYLWHYDAGFLALVALFLYRMRLSKPPIYFWILLAVFWFGPGIPVVNHTLFHIVWIYPTLVLPPMLFAAFTFSLLQVKHPRYAAET
ncbi:MAG: glycosyltransferase family 87 protein [Pseudomonadota bacterium]